MEKWNMKKVFCAVLFCLFSFAVCAEEFDPAACPDFSAKLFPGNNNQSVLLVTASGYTHSGFGGVACRQVYEASDNGVEELSETPFDNCRCGTLVVE
jgi:hypothetical protein